MKTNKTDFGHLAALIEEDDRDQQTREGMTDVEAGHIIDHQAVQAEAHDAWFRDKVKEALADTWPTVTHKQVMDEAQALIDRKRRRA